MIHTNLGINENGHLTMAGQDTTELAKKYQTPLYLIDEQRVRENCRIYKNAMDRFFDKGGVLYASKALCFKDIYRIIGEEGISADVVSGGEIYTAYKAGFNMENIYFHGNNKTEDELELALNCKVGHFICDNYNELTMLNRLAGAHGITQKILLRLTPGIDTHTYEAVRTGQVDSKFGTPIETGQAMELIKYMLTLENLEPEGFHCHVGSQVFDGQTFCDSADIMIDFIKEVYAETGYMAQTLNLGGGYGVRYVDSDGCIDIAASIGEVSEHIKKKCAASGIEMPAVFLEPGRSIVADAGMTLYTVGSVKTVKGYKDYVAVDGGMTDNPRFALYGSLYSAVIANRAGENADFKCTIVGKCCESGDVIAENINLQKPKSGDILAVMVTGAYNYSMASNYNRIPRPPIVILKDGESRIGVKRETYDDIIKLDL